MYIINKQNLQFLILVIVSYISICYSSNVTETPKKIKCPDIRDANFEDGGPQYCNCTYREFRRRYNVANLKLTSLLEKLRAWGCPQFEDECENRRFDFNRYTYLVYEKFCNRSNFFKECTKEIRTLRELHNLTALRQQGKNFEEIYYGDLIFSSPCLQVSSYHYGKLYYEISRPIASFCDSVWCGFNNLTIGYQSPSTWLCLPTRCRINIVVVLLFCGIFAFGIIIANLTIIIVILRNPRFPTSQLIYKLSLAFADVLVGIFVVPSFIITLYTFHVGPYQRRTDIKDSFANLGTKVSDISDKFDQNANVYYRPETTQGYRDFFGFITTFSFSISVYTLMFASYDRFKALSQPLRYNRDRAVTYAKYITSILWVASLIFGLLPIIVPDLGPYRIVAGGILIAVDDEISVYVLGSAMVFPFLIMWLFTISVKCIVKSQMRTRKELMSRKQNHHSTTERRLSKTLSVMVGVFTACILPAIIFLTIPEFVPSINPQNIKHLTKKPAAAFLSMELAVTIILASNSLWNAFIYSIRNKEFRKDAASLHRDMASAIGLLRFKKAFSECLTKTAYDGRRKISSAFTITDFRKKSSSTSEESISTAQSTRSKRTFKSSGGMESFL